MTVLTRLCCRIHFCCLFNIGKEILCVHLAACVEKKIQSDPCTPLHKRVDRSSPSNWHNMLRNDLRCLSSVGIQGQVWASLSVPEWLMAGFTPICFDHGTTTCSCHSHLAQVTESDLSWNVSWQVNSVAHLTQRHSTLSARFTFLRRSCTREPIATGVRRVWRVSPWLSWQSALLLSKVFHGGLSKAGWNWKVYHPWIYGDKMSFQSLWRQNCHRVALITNSNSIAASSYLNFDFGLQHLFSDVVPCLIRNLISDYILWVDIVGTKHRYFWFTGNADSVHNHRS